MEWKEFTGKTVDEAITNACLEFGTSSEKIEYEVVEKESNGLLGLLRKPAIIKASLKDSVEDKAKIFLKNVFEAMNMNVAIETSLDKEENILSVDLTGSEMGILIGKRGGTLDSLQYLVSLVINKNNDDYVKVKLDTENYRERRKETLENLAKNLASKVKRIHKPVYLEPMNPYERRIIHFALQNDEYVETHSEGEEPYRKVVITLKPGVKLENDRRGGYGRNSRSYGNRNNGGYHKKYNNDGYRGKNSGYKSSYNNNNESVKTSDSTDND